MSSTSASRSGCSPRQTPPATALTAIYYVHAPHACELDLLDPRANVDYFDPGIAIAGEGSRVRLRCSPGELLLFPGWVKHAVPEFDEDGVRISISWNLGYKIDWG
jgi:Putative 2OG-Fe(II) oxygenase